MAKTIEAIVAGVRSGEIDPVALVDQHLKLIEENEPSTNAFITVLADHARQKAGEIASRVAAGDPVGRLAGVPVAVKDNLCLRGAPTTCASRILEHWHPPYDATVLSRLLAEDAIIVGKTNMDEFAMGSSTEHSARGPTHNPRDMTRVPGGSSGGSAAAVAARFAQAALGSDTGGSIRQPAAFCGVVGLKPTYGLVSRYGLVAFASSLDQVGPLAGSVADAALLLEIIAGHDHMDSTSLDAPAPRLAGQAADSAEGLSIGIVRELSDGADPEVKRRLDEAAESLERAGARVESCSIPEVSYALPAYYLLAPAEASSNLARYDGVRYGLRVNAADTPTMNARTRSVGFGAEVKRRIMLGTYALRAGYYDAYYGQAQRVRTLLIRAFDAAYERYDALLSPTAPTTAFRLKERVEDPIAMYLSDVCTIPSNLAGHPAISVPFGTGEAGMPVGVQVMAPALAEAVMVRVATILEQAAP